MVSEIDNIEQEIEVSSGAAEPKDDERLAKETDPRYLFRQKIEERLERKRLLEEFGDL